MYLYLGDRKYNFNFEYIDLDKDGKFDYRYRVIDLHHGGHGKSEIWKVKFYNMDSLKIIGREVYSADSGKWEDYDTFEPWDYGFRSWKDHPPGGINNWMELEGFK